MSTSGDSPDQKVNLQLSLPNLCIIDENGREIPYDLRSHPSHNTYGHDSRKIDLYGLSETPGQFLSPDCPLQQLKAVANRLNLSLRRKSIPDWKLDNIHSNDIPSHIRVSEETTKSDWKTQIDGAIEWLYTELEDMRSQDAHLAREFLNIRHEIHQMKLQKSCEKLREMLDEAAIDVEESSHWNDVSDLPDYVVDTSLRQLGVMRMHLNSRRFSTC